MKETAMVCSRYCPIIYVEGLRKTTLNLNEVKLLMTYLIYMIYRTPKSLDYYE
jgi:hypothetical protein